MGRFPKKRARPERIAAPRWAARRCGIVPWRRLSVSCNTMSDIHRLTPFQLANILEALLWMGIGIGFLVVAYRRVAVARAYCAIAALLLIIFGVSDLVEVATGAWWRPWWLLLWKTLCVCGLLIVLLQHYRSKRQYRS